MELYFDIRKREGKWHRIYHRARVGPAASRFEFDHEKAELTLKGEKTPPQSMFSYADVFIEQPSTIEAALGRFLRVLFPALDSEQCYVVAVPKARLHFEMRFPLRKQDRVNDWIKCFEKRRAALLKAQDFALLLDEKARGKHLLQMPKGAASTEGTPVAIPLSLYPYKK